MRSASATVEAYLDELPPDRRQAIATVRNAILKNLGKGYVEGMLYGMIGYAVPHSLFPAGYHCDPRLPLAFAGLASQKHYMALYLMCCSSDCDGNESPYLKWFRAAWAKSGKKLDMGKSCIRFKKLDDLPLDVIGEAIRRVSVQEYIRYYLAGLESSKVSKPARKTAARKAPSKKPEAAGRTTASSKPSRQ